MKTLLLSCLFLCCSLVAANQALPVYEGTWQDGAAFAWQCQPGSSGKVAFLFKTTDNTVYRGTLSCGQPV